MLKVLLEVLSHTHVVGLAIHRSLQLVPKKELLLDFRGVESRLGGLFLFSGLLDLHCSQKGHECMPILDGSPIQEDERGL